MEEMPVTSKTRDEVLLANLNDLNWDEKAIQALLEAYPDWTLEQAIQNREIVPRIFINKYMEKPVTDKTAEQLAEADPKTLTSTEQILRQLIRTHKMTLEEAIEALEELP